MDKSPQEKLERLFDRPDLKLRATAAVIDVFIGCLIIFLSFFPGFISGGTFIISGTLFLGSVLSALFILLKDGLHNSSSPGKKILNLKVTGKEGNFINLAESAARNFLPSLPFWAVAAYFLSTLLAAWIGDTVTYIALLSVPVSLFLLSYDVVHMLNDRESSLRWSEVQIATVVEES
jgi:uncharacterized RDD family membrane protein YckC